LDGFVRGKERHDVLVHDHRNAPIVLCKGRLFQDESAPHTGDVYKVTQRMAKRKKRKMEKRKKRKEENRDNDKVWNMCHQWCVSVSVWRCYRCS
jgi:hypothetical protein